MNENAWAGALVIAGLILFFTGYTIGAQSINASRQQQIDQKDRLLSECTAIAKERGKERDTYQRELTDSVVMLRKLDGLMFHLYYDSECIAVSRGDDALSGDAINLVRMNLNKIREFAREQRKRVHWDLEDPIPELRPMSEEELKQFQESLRARNQE